NLIGSFASFLMIIPSIRGARLAIDRRLLKAVLLFSIPLFLGGLAGISNDLLDRFFIEALLPDAIKWEELGIYTAATKVTALMVIFTQMYRYAAEPMFLAKFKNDDFKIANAEVMTFFVLASIAIFLGVTLYIGLFKYIVAEEFRGAMSLVPVMLVSAGLMGIFLNLNFWYKYVEKTYFAIIITVSGLIVSVLLDLWFIPLWGIDGAAYAKLASMFFMVALSFYFNQKYYPIPYKIGRMLEYTGLAAIIFVIAKYMNIKNCWIDYSVRSLLFLIFIGYAIKRERILLLLKQK
ncbi:MAG: oligosaccharide flippase family protein, partial [Rikenellaceae bacterium]